MESSKQYWTEDRKIMVLLLFFGIFCDIMWLQICEGGIPCKTNLWRTRTRRTTQPEFGRWLLSGKVVGGRRGLRPLCMRSPFTTWRRGSRSITTSTMSKTGKTSLSSITMKNWLNSLLNWGNGDSSWIST